MVQLKGSNHTVAVAVRLEHIPDEDKVFLVFEVVDEKFKKKIKEDWSQDIEFKVIEKKLVLNED